MSQLGPIFAQFFLFLFLLANKMLQLIYSYTMFLLPFLLTFAGGPSEVFCYLLFLLLVFLLQLLLDRRPDESMHGLGGLEAHARALKVLLLRERARAVREQDVGKQLFLFHDVFVVFY